MRYDIAIVGGGPAGYTAAESNCRRSEKPSCLKRKP